MQLIIGGSLLAVTFYGLYKLGEFAEKSHENKRMDNEFDRLLDPNETNYYKAVDQCLDAQYEKLNDAGTAGRKGLEALMPPLPSTLIESPNEKSYPNN